MSPDEPVCIGETGRLPAGYFALSQWDSDSTTVEKAEGIGLAGFVEAILGVVCAGSYHHGRKWTE